MSGRSQSADKTTILTKHSDIACWSTEKTEFKTKNNDFENLTMLKTVKGGLFGLFENPICCKISNSLRDMDPLETLKIFEKKVSQCRRKLNGGPFSDFQGCSKIDFEENNQLFQNNQLN